MEYINEKFTINEYLNQKQLKKVKITPITDENKICVTVKNNSSENLQIHVYEIVILIMKVLNSKNIDFSISHQYKNNNKGIDHIDITYANLK